jgi:hypothetical protein
LSWRDLSTLRRAGCVPVLAQGPWGKVEAAMVGYRAITKLGSCLRNLQRGDIVETLSRSWSWSEAARRQPLRLHGHPHRSVQVQVQHHRRYRLRIRTTCPRITPSIPLFAAGRHPPSPPVRGVPHDHPDRSDLCAHLVRPLSSRILLPIAVRRGFRSLGSGTSPRRCRLAVSAGTALAARMMGLSSTRHYLLLYRRRSWSRCLKKAGDHAGTGRTIAIATIRFDIRETSSTLMRRTRVREMNNLAREGVVWIVGRGGILLLRRGGILFPPRKAAGTGTKTMTWMETEMETEMVPRRTTRKMC